MRLRVMRRRESSSRPRNARGQAKHKRGPTKSPNSAQGSRPRGLPAPLREALPGRCPPSRGWRPHSPLGNGSIFLPAPPAAPTAKLGRRRRVAGLHSSSSSRRIPRARAGPAAAAPRTAAPSKAAEQPTSASCPRRAAPPAPPSRSASPRPARAAAPPARGAALSPLRMPPCRGKSGTAPGQRRAGWRAPGGGWACARRRAVRSTLLAPITY